jgi:hypothetical protein
MRQRLADSPSDVGTRAWAAEASNQLLHSVPNNWNDHPPARPYPGVKVMNLIAEFLPLFIVRWYAQRYCERWDGSTTIGGKGIVVSPRWGTYFYWGTPEALEKEQEYFRLEQKLAELKRDVETSK